MFKFLTVLALAGAAGVALGETPAASKNGWARDGQALDLECAGGASHSAGAVHGDSSVTLECPAGDTLRVLYKKNDGTTLRLDVPWKEIDGGTWRPREILWSPGGLAFLLNGSSTDDGRSDFQAFRIENGSLVREAISNAARQDMVVRLARCWPYIRDLAGAEPRFNTFAVAWKHDTLDVVTEVPCNARYENSMCSVYGYEMHPGTGAIARVLSAAEVNNTWYPHMRWSMAASDLPSCDPDTGKVVDR
jgi:hypothetical protein